jgi:hypothetical protein
VLVVGKINRRHGPAGFYVNERLIRPAIKRIGALFQ